MATGDYLFIFSGMVYLEYSILNFKSLLISYLLTKRKTEMKKFTFLCVLMTYFVSADAARLCRTNWPDMGLNCIIVNNNRVSVELILESTSKNAATYSDFKVVINNRSIPISFFRVSSTPFQGYYEYRYTYSESHTQGDDQFEYKIDYISLPPNVFRVFSSLPNTQEKKPICNPNNESPNYLKLSDNKSIPITNIYPNPFSDQINIEYQVDREYDVIVDIIDVNGKLLQRYSPKNNKLSNQKQKIDTSLLAPGIYYCRVHNDSGSSIQKIVKTK